MNRCRFLPLLAFAATFGCGGGESTSTSVANGDLGPWRSEAALPVPTANHCSTLHNDWLVTIGGNHREGDGQPFLRHDDVLIAEIGDDGILSGWVTVGQTPSPVQGCMLTSDGGRLLLVGGTYDSLNHGEQVWVADLATDGTLGEWGSMGSFPDESDLLIGGSEVWLSGQTLLTNGSTLPQERNLSFTASVDIGGAVLGEWKLDTWLEGFRFQAQQARVGQYVYFIGGYGLVGESNVVFDDVHRATLDENAAVTSSAATSSLPAPLNFGEAAAVDDFVFVIGGRRGIVGGPYTSDVLVAEVNLSDGSLGAWAPRASLPVEVSSHEVVVGDERVYVIGGSNESAQLASVYSAQVRSPPAN